jgi:protoheme IX farnesyltransferase
MPALSQYYRLTKPGIIYGNLIPAIAGYLLGTRWHIDWFQAAALLIGLALVIGSACVINNVTDRRIDALMARTKSRALVSGAIGVTAALVYAAALAIAGFTALILGTNLLAASIALFAVFAYVVLYGFAKRHSVHGTLVGTISGALPGVIGYAAATGRFDDAALILFISMVCWQMPHFYAIAIYRSSDYAAAGIPVLPLKKGQRATKIQMLIYTLAFTLSAGLLTVAGYTGYVYWVIVTALGLTWLARGATGFNAPDANQWARRMFGFSLIVLLVFSAAVALGPLLP